LRIKNFGKYIIFAAFFSFAVLSYTQSTTSNAVSTKAEQSRIVIKPYKAASVPESSAEGVSAAVTKENSGVELLPVPDTSKPIVLTQLK
jgi:hypothetical protein